jgi:hypothetical protein
MKIRHQPSPQTPPQQNENTPPPSPQTPPQQNENTPPPSPQTPPQQNENTTNPNTNHEAAPEQKPNNLEQENTITPDKEPEIYTEEINIQENKDFSDISNHFLSQHKVVINVIRNNNIGIWETVVLEIQITNKETNEIFHGILPFWLDIFSQNGKLEGNISTLQLMSKWKNSIYFTAKEVWSSNIIITIDNQKIAVIPIQIK